MTETVECQGNEAKLEDCQIKYKTNHGVCKPEQSIVSVTCVHDTFASCEDNEVPWKQKCYSVYFNRPVLLLCHLRFVSLQCYISVADQLSVFVHSERQKFTLFYLFFFICILISVRLG